MSTLESLNASTTTVESTSRSRFNLLNSRLYPWVIIALASLFLFYKYVLQIGPSVMTNQLMQQFQLTGAGLGNLAATFFYSYLIAQLFAGPLLDRFSPRLLTALAIGLCALGALTFPGAPSLFDACISRMMIGVGAAFATISYIKFTAMWFKPSQFAFVTGLIATAAMAGSMAGQVPMAYLVETVGWQNALYASGIFGVVLAALFFLVARNKAEPVAAQVVTSSTIRLADFTEVLKQKRNWYLMFYSGLAFTPLAVFGGLWGDPFLQKAYHVSNTEAASLVSLMFLGLAVGGPLLGVISDKIGKRYSIMLLGSMMAFISLTMVIYVNALPISMVGTLLFLFGLGSAGFMLSFAVGKEINRAAVAGTVVALINTGDAVFGAVTEPLLGKFLDVFWQGKTANSVHIFSLHNYHIAMSLLPVYLLFAVGFVLLVKRGQN